MTNEVLQALLSRRSCRAYADRTVERELLDEVLRVGTYAPTGMNRQSPIMLVADSPERIKELSRLNAEVMGATGDPFYGAPIVVSVLADSRIRTWQEDGSLVIGNLLNAAHALGLAGCWIHRAREVFASSRGREILDSLGIGEEYVGVGHCILGYPKEAPGEAKPRKEGYIRYI